MDDKWLEPFECSYRFVRVERATGHELSEVDGIQNGGSIDRNQDTDLFESASLPFCGGFDIGTDLLRVYLDASFLDGRSATECLGTFLPVVPERDAPLDTGTVQLYGRLKEVDDNGFDEPRVLLAGSLAVEAAAEMVRECGLECIADESDYRLSATWVFGADSSGSADAGQTMLGAVNALMEVAGFCAARTDPWGRVVLAKYAEPEDRQPAAEFVEGPNARFEVSATDALDSSSVCNVVYVDYSSQGVTIRGTAIDEDPDSRFSVQALGRRVVKRYEYSDLPGDAPEDTNILEGADRCELGTGTKESGTFRASGSSGTVEQTYVGDCPVPGVCLGFKVTSTGGEIGFAQDKCASAQKDEDYSQSVWVKGQPGVRGMIQIWWSSDGNGGSAQKEFQCTGEWQEVKNTDTCGVSREVSIGYCYLESAGSAVFACPKVEKGAEPTPWPNAAMREAADAKAAELLRTERAIVRTATLRHVYAPVRVGDAVSVSYTTGAIAGKFAVRAQAVSLEAGCPVKETLRSFDRGEKK